VAHIFFEKKEFMTLRFKIT